MTLRQKIEGVLDTHCIDPECEKEISCKKCVSQATDKILEAVREELPKEKKGRFVVGAQDSGHWVMTDEADGFNQAIAEVKEMMR